MVEVVEAKRVGMINPGGRDAITNSLVCDHIGIDINNIEGQVLNVNAESCNSREGLVGMIDIPTLNGLMIKMRLG